MAKVHPRGFPEAKTKRRKSRDEKAVSFSTGTTRPRRRGLSISSPCFMISPCACLLIALGYQKLRALQYLLLERSSHKADMVRKIAYFLLDDVHIMHPPPPGLGPVITAVLYAALAHSFASKPRLIRVHHASTRWAGWSVPSAPCKKWWCGLRAIRRCSPAWKLLPPRVSFCSVLLVRNATTHGKRANLWFRKRDQTVVAGAVNNVSSVSIAS